jgi:hypothetical protein
MVKPKDHVVNRIYHVVPDRDHMVKWNYHVVKSKSDMAKNWKPLVFSLKPRFLGEDGQKTTMGGVSVGLSGRDGRQRGHNFHRFQTHGDDLADETDDIFFVIHAVGVAGDVSLLVAGHAVLVYHRTTWPAAGKRLFG